MKLLVHIRRYFSHRWACVWFDRQRQPTDGDSIAVGEMIAVFHPDEIKTTTGEELQNKK